MCGTSARAQAREEMAGKESRRPLGLAALVAMMIAFRATDPAEARGMKLASRTSLVQAGGKGKKAASKKPEGKENEAPKTDQ